MPCGWQAKYDSQHTRFYIYWGIHTGIYRDIILSNQYRLADRIERSWLSSRPRARWNNLQKAGVGGGGSTFKF